LEARLSQQRLCDLDGAIIRPTIDLFYTVTDARSGKTLDVCEFCARTRNVPVWAPATPYSAHARVQRTTGLGRYVFEATGNGTSGDTEPAWPNAQGHAGDTIIDGTLTWLARPAPNENAITVVKMPGQTATRTTMYGWMSGSNEPTS
jgi:hypothetical protein